MAEITPQDKSLQLLRKEDRVQQILEFLQLILPEPEPREYVFGMSLTIKNGDGRDTPRHAKHTSLADLATWLVEEDQDQQNVYFALSIFAEVNGEIRRKKICVILRRSLSLDIDVGKGQGYSTKEEALAALDLFCQERFIPPSAVVDSGNGIQAHWAIEEILGREDWENLADRFKQFTAKCGLRADPTTTSDAARVLRPPLTHNRKDPTNPKPTLLLQGSGTRYDLEDIDKRLPALSAEPWPTRPVNGREVSGSLFPPGVAAKPFDLDKFISRLDPARAAIARKLFAPSGKTLSANLPTDHWFDDLDPATQEQCLLDAVGACTDAVWADPAHGGGTYGDSGRSMWMAARAGLVAHGSQAVLDEFDRRSADAVRRGVAERSGVAQGAWRSTTFDRYSVRSVLAIAKQCGWDESPWQNAGLQLQLTGLQHHVLEGVEGSIFEHLAPDLDTPFKTISADMGAGKTYAIAGRIREHLVTNDGSLLVVAAEGIRGIHRLGEYIVTLFRNDGLDVEDAHDLGVRTWYADTADKSTDEALMGSLPKLNKNVGVLITHRHYLLRKGQSELVYPIWRALRDLNRTAHLIIDEFDGYLDGLAVTIPLYSRYREQTRSGARLPMVRSTEKCPAFLKNGSCRGCRINTQTAIHLVTAHQTVEWHHSRRTDYNTGRADGDTIPNQRLVDELGDGVSSVADVDHVRIRTHLWHELEERRNFTVNIDRHIAPAHSGPPNPGAMREFDYTRDLQSIRNCALKPRLYQTAPIIFGEDEETHVADPKDLQDGIDPQVQYPSTACGLPIFTAIDGAPLKLLHEHFATVRGLSATLDGGHKELLEHADFGTWCHVAPRVEVSKLKEVLILIVPNDWNVAKPEVLQDLGAMTVGENPAKSVIFMPTSTRAEGFIKSKAIRGTATEVCLRDTFANDSQTYGKEDAGNQPESRVLVSYAGSSLARGANLRDHDINIVHMGTDSPAVAARSMKPMTEATMQTALNRLRAVKAIQPAGRTLRPRVQNETGRRVVILTHPPRIHGKVNQPALELVVKAIVGRFENFHIRVVLSGNDTFKAAQDFLNKGAVPKEQVIQKSRKVRTRKRSRSEVNVAFCTAVEKIRGSLAARLSWGQARDASNIRRHIGYLEQVHGRDLKPLATLVSEQYQAGDLEDGAALLKHFGVV